MARLAEKFAAAEDLAFQGCADSVAAIAALKQSAGAIIWCHVTKKEQVLPVVQFLRQIKVPIQTGGFKVCVFSSLKQPEVMKAFLDNGAFEFIADNSPEKTVLFKMSRIAKALKTKLNSFQPKAREVEKKSVRDAKNSNAAASIKQKSDESIRTVFRPLPALDIKPDFWLLLDASPRKVMGRWTIRLHGPGPYAGHWVEEVGKDSNRVWVWTPEVLGAKVNPFAPSEGRWTFLGNRPEFKNEAWSFSGGKMELLFEPKDLPPAKKAFVDEKGQLQVTQDSVHGLEFLPKIKESIEGLFRVTGEKKRAEDSRRVEDEKLQSKEQSIDLNKDDQGREFNDRRGVTGDPQNFMNQHDLSTEPPEKRASRFKSAETEAAAKANPKPMRHEDVELPPGEVQDIRKKMQRFTRSLDSSTGRSPEGSKDSAGIRPISVAVLLSEWLSDSKRPLTEVAHLYCSSVEAIFGKAEVELWQKRGKTGWKCLAKSHRKPAEFYLNADQGQDQCQRLGDGSLACPVKDDDNRTIAVLVVKAEQSSETQLDDILAVSALARGFVASLAA